MSLQAEVPYDDAQSDSDLEEDGWRDPTILPEVNIPRHNLDDVDFSFESQDQQPDDCWMLPPEFPLNRVLGEGLVKLTEIRHATSTSLKYNEHKHQVDIWGERNSVQRAKRLLDLLVTHVNEHSDANRRKTKKWERPERELTAREKKRVERQQARKTEEKIYQGIPDAAQPYNALVPLPDDSIPLVKVFGIKDAFLNRLRAECKCWIYHDAGMNAVRITGEEEARVTAAAARVRNWYLRCARSPYLADVRVVKQPKKNMIIQLNHLPVRFLTYKYFSPPVPMEQIQRHRLLEGLVSGRYDGASLPKANLIDLDDAPEPSSTQENDPDTELPPSIANLNKENAKRIENALQMGLESIRLSNMETRMKIRFGQICMLDYPPTAKQVSVDDLANKWFIHPKIKSALAPCVGRTLEDMKPLFEYLSQHCTQFNDSPRTTYTFDAVQSIAFPSRPEPGSRTRREQVTMESEMIETTTICKFTSEGRVCLWNTLTDVEDQVTVSCVDLEREYSWELKLQHAHRLGTETMDTPHGKFVEHLKLNPTTQRPILIPESTYYNPKTVTQRTKWVYEFEKKWIIEVGRDEIWDIPLIMRRDKADEKPVDPRRRGDEKNLVALPIDLSTKQPERVIFKVSMYHEDWVNRFAGNLWLGIGEAPGWTIRDFLASEDENVDTIIEMAQKMTSILAKEVPQYWTTLV